MKYLSAKQIAENYDFSAKTARNLIKEMREQIDLGRYPATVILDGCGVRVSESALIDYLKNRRALRNAIARKYVEEYEEETL